MTGRRMLDGDIDYSWEADAHCRKLGLDPDVFFPEREEHTHRAIGYCRQCPVSLECYNAAAIRREPFGVFGGVNFGSNRRAKLRQEQAMEDLWAGNTNSAVVRISGRQVAPCGTRAAYKRHRRHGEQPCGPCVEAMRAYGRERWTHRERSVPTTDEQRRLRAADAAEETA